MKRISLVKRNLKTDLIHFIQDDLGKLNAFEHVFNERSVSISEQFQTLHIIVKICIKKSKYHKSLFQMLAPFFVTFYNYFFDFKFGRVNQKKKGGLILIIY